MNVVAEVPAYGFLATTGDSVFGPDEGAQLWRFDLASGKIHRATVQLPEGNWDSPYRWARDSGTGLLFTADATGRLFSFDGKKEFRFLGKTHLSPVGPMAVTGDGRLYGFCGNDMANLFCCDMAAGAIAISELLLQSSNIAVMDINSARPSPGAMGKSSLVRTITADIYGSIFPRSWHGDPRKARLLQQVRARLLNSLQTGRWSSDFLVIRPLAKNQGLS